MIFLKKYLDELAGPHHPFAKCAPVEGLFVTASDEKNDREVNLDDQLRQALNKFLRINKN